MTNEQILEGFYQLSEYLLAEHKHVHLETEQAKALINAIKELQKENAELKAKISKVVSVVNDDNSCHGDLRRALGLKWQDPEEIEQLKSQIEKMKCCQNCKHHEVPPTKASVRFCVDCYDLDETKDNIVLNKWELAE